MSAGETAATEGARIRLFRDGDLPGLYDVCVRTGDYGADARGRFDTEVLLGDLYAAPYAYLEPEHAFVLDDGGRVAGYCLGAAHTRRFVQAWRQRWLPQIAERHPPLTRPPQTPSEELVDLIHHPEHMIVPELDAYPAHLHINLLPGYQGRGFGRQLTVRLLEALAAAGAAGVHLGVATRNEAARAFYRRLGFAEFDVPGQDPGGRLMVRSTAGDLT